MNYSRRLKKYWYLIIATGAILLATLALVVMQYRAARGTESQAQATFVANLDIHLLALADEARRDMVEHADHVSSGAAVEPFRQRGFDPSDNLFPNLSFGCRHLRFVGLKRF